MEKKVSKELAIEIATKICGYVEIVEKVNVPYSIWSCRAGVIEVLINVDYYPNKSVAFEYMKYPHGFIRINHLKWPKAFNYKDGELVFDY